MEKKISQFQVFIAHSSIDTWVVRQIARHIEACGVSTFLDEDRIPYTSDVDARIREGINSSHELLVLLTPWAATRPNVWVEVGRFLQREQPIATVLHGPASWNPLHELNITGMVGMKHLTLNEIDRYFLELKGRVDSWKGSV